MSPKKVDKKQKRKEIALSCTDLIYDMGIKKMTISQVAKTAGIGKGTVYEYFENKEDIVFEIISIHINNYHKEFLESIKSVKSTKDKIKHFFKFVLDDSVDNLKNFNGYKEFLSIVLSNENPKMKDFNCETSEFFKEQLSIVIKEGIKNGELIPESLELVNGIFIFEKGLILLKMSEKDYNPLDDFEKFIDSIFKLIEVKNS